MNHQEAWQKLKQKVDAASEDLTDMVSKAPSSAGKTPLWAKLEALDLVQSWIRNIETSLPVDCEEGKTRVSVNRAFDAIENGELVEVKREDMEHWFLLPPELRLKWRFFNQDGHNWEYRIVVR